MESDKLYCCNCTAEGFSNVFEIRKHYRNFHKGFDEKCKICSNQFRRTDDLKAHEEDEHGKKTEIVKMFCIHCKKGF
ncbi:hypothetical protein AQUCO_01600148v1 [Aquilegia coerulea]|uniref:C2H2-type domain-containing protein n=1 Tax=Aquilegia coerulea TaxID=218851 RepID=A0A2G5DQC5_AQUCA|nr:hypothetical protein AQUCO_01600148v1 [Aquilegia coerulea]